MQPPSNVSWLSFALGLLLGVCLTGLWLWTRRRLARNDATRLQLELATTTAYLHERERQVAGLERDIAAHKQELDAHALELRKETERRSRAEADLALEQRAAGEKLALLDDAQKKLVDVFRALSADALSQSSRSFLDLAHASLAKYQEAAKGDLTQRQTAIAQLLAPVQQSLAKVDVRIGEIERSREHAYGALLEQLRGLTESQNVLRTEAANLVRALRAPQVRGRWGEVQLRRVVELAGMVNYCDFTEQESVTTDAARLRPDLVVKLPGGKRVVVDAKAPLAAYLEAIEAQSDEQRTLKLVEHARQVRDHITALSRKSYWDQFQPAPEFVVLFLPGETFFSAALEQDPSLIEAGATKNVVLATPTTLIALLKAVAYGWRQEVVAENARAISELGRELYKRVADVSGHFMRLGRSLQASVEAYNRAVGSLETRVLVSARRFKDLEAAALDDEMATLTPVEQTPRALNAPELVAGRVADSESAGD